MPTGCFLCLNLRYLQHILGAMLVLMSNFADFIAIKILGLNVTFALDVRSVGIILPPLRYLD